MEINLKWLTETMRLPRIALLGIFVAGFILGNILFD